MSLITFKRTLKHMGYKFCEARRKGILSYVRLAKRVKFVPGVQTFEDNFWKCNVCFYLDGVTSGMKRTWRMMQDHENI